nr:DUF1631 family protein [Dechloromonas sp.]
MTTPSPDRYETLRDCRSLYLSQLGNLLAASGALSAPALQAIQQGAGEWFDEIAASRQRGSFEEQADGLTSSRITLVGHDELELEIRLDNLTARLLDSTAGNLWKTQLRFITLLHRPDLPKASNPVGPGGIRLGFAEMFAAAGSMALDKKLDLVDKLEGHLLAHLPALYATINDFLDKSGVDAAQPSIVTAQESSRKTPPEATAVPPAGNLLLALQQSLAAQVPAAPPAAAALAGSGAPASNPAGSAAVLLNQAVTERLLQRLDEIDRQPPPTFEPARSNSLESLIPGLFAGETAQPEAIRPRLDADALGLPAHAPEAVVVDTLALIFDTILADPAWPDALKSIIASLQITLLKVAMQDPVFFTDPAHPARRVLDNMGEAMRGLPQDVPPQHPLCVRLAAIAAELRTAFAGDPFVFVRACEAVEAAGAEHRARIIRGSDDYLPLLAQLDRRDQAVAATRARLDPLIAPDLPVAVRSFLDQSWRRLLHILWLEQGPQGGAWEANLDAVRELLWTFQPKADPEGRANLARRLPEILKQLKAGMERIGLDAAAQEDFLDACFALQTRAMRPAPANATPPETKPSLAVDNLQRGDDRPSDGEVSSGVRCLRSLDFAGYRPPPSRPLPLKPGDWLDITVDETANPPLMLCQFSPISQRALLCNPAHELALAVHPARLEGMLRDGSARICRVESLFETAAARALTPRTTT